ncbi:LytTR family DNA-binding domain-containing protein [Draconibacterium sp. IB214405]|uniref:LytR/AlgR family response regulator transcription factor n=1 Tax=Draconibacterium sp. IB214405 TaxID=3097352 RepID=UPI002A12E157|nr:LytTR family DNA-binding domain-containing protein [Draconibacterium sp. IB214405]MDX8338207.1 LytTR family DNA-binding domain-containing protein [Draconibacterium sp. IB214405]
MTKYNAIIIDDEANVQEALKILLQRNCPNVNICATAGSAGQGRELLKKWDVQLIFLDISMPGENGFDFLASIPKEDYAIIFTTAYEEYALRAIKTNAIDYLLKPINPDELKDAVSKASSHLDLRLHHKEIQKTYEESLNNLTIQAHDGFQYAPKITVIEKFGFQIIEVDKIRYIEADGSYCVIHLSGLQKVVSSKTVGEIEKVLDPSVFIRIHKSTLLNISYLRGFSSFEGNFAILDDDTHLVISRRKYNEFKDAVDNFSKSID